MTLSKNARVAGFLYIVNSLWRREPHLHSNSLIVHGNGDCNG